MLLSYPGVREAQAYVGYAEGNKLLLQADVRGEESLETEGILAYLAEKCPKTLIPAELHINE